MTFPDPLKPVEEFLTPVGDLILQVRKLRETASDDLKKLPATDPMKEVLDRFDRILEEAEAPMIRAAKRPPGVKPLDYFLGEMEKLRDEIGKERALPGDVFPKSLPLPRLPRGKK